MYFNPHWSLDLQKYIIIKTLPLHSFSGFYKLNVDAVSLIKGGKLGIDVAVRDNDGVVVGVSCWQIFSLIAIFRCCRSFIYAKGFEICERHVFSESFSRIRCF